MSYSLYLFAAKSVDVAHRFKADSQLVGQLLDHISRKATPSHSDIARFESLLRKGVSGNWPVDDTTDSFQAFCWLLDMIAEAIELNSLRGFRGLDLLYETHLWHHFLNRAAPIPVPISRNQIPVVGYMRADDLVRCVKTEQASETKIPASSRSCRVELLELMESIGSDGLDMFAVLTIW